VCDAVQFIRLAPTLQRTVFVPFIFILIPSNPIFNPCFSLTARHNFHTHTDIIVSLLTQSVRTFYFLSLLRTNKQQEPGIESRWRVRFFRKLPDRPWRRPSLLYSGYRVSFPGVKRPGRGVDHTPHLVSSLKKE